MAGWMAMGSFALLIITVLLLLTCIVLLIVKFFMDGGNTGCTGHTGLFSSPNYYSVHNSANVGVDFGSGSDRDGDFANRSELNLTKDAFYSNLKLDNSTLNTNGYRLFVSGTLTLLNNAVIQNAGYAGGANNGFGQGWVPGGLGGKPGTLGGGGAGGFGALKQPACDKMRGGKSPNCLLGSNTTLFQGADGALSSSVSSYGIGLAGGVGFQSMRSISEAAQILNGRHVPVAPLLSGGSGGGGGQGTNQHPGSGGGGGGGVVAVIAKQLVVGKGGGTINVAGGNAGTVVHGGPLHATSGGGGGGGLILLATLSAPESYSGLVYNVDGGSSVNAQGELAQANSGRVVDWFNHSLEPHSHQFMLAQTTTDQILTKENPKIRFHEILINSAGITHEKDALNVEVGGLYLIHVHLLSKAVPPPHKHQVYVVRNDEEPLPVPQNHSTVLQLQPQDSIHLHIDSSLPTGTITLLPHTKLTLLLLTPI